MLSCEEFDDLIFAAALQEGYNVNREDHAYYWNLFHTSEWINRVIDNVQLAFVDSSQLIDGAEHWLVLSATTRAGTQFFRREGSYVSYDGGLLDSKTREVHMQERTIIVYE